MARREFKQEPILKHKSDLIASNYILFLLYEELKPSLSEPQEELRKKLATIDQRFREQCLEQKGSFRALKTKILTIIQSPNKKGLAPPSAELQRLIAPYQIEGVPLPDDKALQAIDAELRNSGKDPEFTGISFQDIVRSVDELFQGQPADSKVVKPSIENLIRIEADFRKECQASKGSFRTLKEQADLVLAQRECKASNEFKALVSKNSRKSLIYDDYVQLDEDARSLKTGEFTGISFNFIRQRLYAVMKGSSVQATPPPQQRTKPKVVEEFPTYCPAEVSDRKSFRSALRTATLSGADLDLYTLLKVAVKTKSSAVLCIYMEPLYQSGYKPDDREAVLRVIKSLGEGVDGVDGTKDLLLDLLEINYRSRPELKKAIAAIVAMDSGSYVAYFKKLLLSDVSIKDIHVFILDDLPTFLKYYSDLSFPLREFMKLVGVFEECRRQVEKGHLSAETLPSVLLKKVPTILTKIFEKSTGILGDLSKEDQHTVFYNLLQRGIQLNFIQKLCHSNVDWEVQANKVLTSLLLREPDNFKEGKPLLKSVQAMRDIFSRTSDSYLVDYDRQRPIIKAILETIKGHFSAMSSEGAVSTTTSSSSSSSTTESKSTKDKSELMSVLDVSEQPEAKGSAFIGPAPDLHLLPAFQHLAMCLLSNQVTVHCMRDDFTRNKTDFEGYLKQIQNIGGYPGHAACFLLMGGIALAPLSGALDLQVKDSILLEFADFRQINLIEFLQSAFSKLGITLENIYPAYVLSIIAGALRGQNSSGGIEDIMRLKSELRFADKMSVASPDERVERADLITHCLLELEQRDLGLQRFWEHHTDHANDHYTTDVVDCYLFMVLPGILDKPHNYLAEFATKPIYKHIQEVVRQCNKALKNNSELTIHEKRAAFFINMMEVERWEGEDKDKGQKITDRDRVKASWRLFFNFVADFLTRDSASHEDMDSLFVIVSTYLKRRLEGRSEEILTSPSGVLSQTGVEISYPRILDYLKAKQKFISYLDSKEFRGRNDLLQTYTNHSDILSILRSPMPHVDSSLSLDASFVTVRATSRLISPRSPLEGISEFEEKEEEKTIGVYRASSFLRRELIEPLIREAGSVDESLFRYLTGKLRILQEEKGGYKKFLDEEHSTLFQMAQGKQSSVGIWYFFEIMDRIPMSSLTHMIKNPETSLYLTPYPVVTEIFQLIKKYQSEMPAHAHDRAILIRVGLKLLGSGGESQQMPAVAIWVKDAIKKTQGAQRLSLYDQFVPSLCQPLESIQVDKLQEFVGDLVESAKAQQRYPYHQRFMQELAADLLVTKPTLMPMFFMLSADFTFADAYKQLDVPGKPASVERIAVFFQQVFLYFQYVDKLLRHAYSINGLTNELRQLEESRKKAIQFFVELSRGLNYSCAPQATGFQKLERAASAASKKSLQERTVVDQTVIFLRSDTGLDLQKRLREEFEARLLDSGQYRVVLSFVKTISEADSEENSLDSVDPQIRRMVLFGLLKVAIETPIHKLPPDEELIELLIKLFSRHNIGRRKDVPTSMALIPCLEYLFGSPQLLPQESEKNLLRAASLIPQFIDALDDAIGEITSEASSTTASILVHDDDTSSAMNRETKIGSRRTVQSPIAVNNSLDVDRIKKALLNWAEEYVRAFLRIENNVCAALMECPAAVLAMHYKQTIKRSTTLTDAKASKASVHLKFTVAETFLEMKDALQGIISHFEGGLDELAGGDKWVVEEYSRYVALRHGQAPLITVPKTAEGSDVKASPAPKQDPTDPSVTAVLGLPYLFEEKPTSKSLKLSEILDRELEYKEIARTDKLRNKAPCYKEVLLATIGFDVTRGKIQKFETDFRKEPESRPLFMRDSKAETLTSAGEELNKRSGYVVIRQTTFSKSFNELASDAVILLQLAHNHGAPYAVERFAKMAVAELAEPIATLLTRGLLINTVEGYRAWRKHFEILQWVAMIIRQLEQPPSGQALMDVFVPYIIHEKFSFDPLSEFIIRYEAMNFPSAEDLFAFAASSDKEIEEVEETKETKMAPTLATMPLEIEFPEDIRPDLSTFPPSPKKEKEEKHDPQAGITEVMKYLLHSLNSSPPKQLVEVDSGVIRGLPSLDLAEPESFFAALFKYPLLAAMPREVKHANAEQYRGPTNAEAILVNQYAVQIILRNASPYVGFDIANYLRAILSGDSRFPRLASSLELPKNSHGDTDGGKKLLNALNLYVKRVEQSYPEWLCIHGLYALFNVTPPNNRRETNVGSALTLDAIEYLLHVVFPGHLQKTYQSETAQAELQERLRAISPPDWKPGQTEEQAEQEQGIIWINYFIQVSTALFPKNKDQLNDLGAALAHTHAMASSGERSALQIKLKEYSLDLVFAVEKQPKGKSTPIRTSVEIAMLRQLTWDARKTQELGSFPRDASSLESKISIGQCWSVLERLQQLHEDLRWKKPLNALLTTAGDEFKGSHLHEACSQLRQPEHRLAVLLSYVFEVIQDVSGNILSQILGTTPETIMSAIKETLHTLHSLNDWNYPAHPDIYQLFTHAFLPHVGMTAADINELTHELAVLEDRAPRPWVRSRMARILLTSYPEQNFSGQKKMLGYYTYAETIFRGSASASEEIKNPFTERSIKGVINEYTDQIITLASNEFGDQKWEKGSPDSVEQRVKDGVSLSTSDIRAFHFLVDAIYQHEKRPGFSELNHSMIKEKFSKAALGAVSGIIDHIRLNDIKLNDIKLDAAPGVLVEFFQTPKLNRAFLIIQELIEGIYPEFKRDSICFLRNPELSHSDAHSVFSAWSELVWSFSYHHQKKTLNDFIKGVYTLELISVAKEEGIEPILQKRKIKRKPILFKCGKAKPSYYIYGFKQGEWQQTSLSSAQLQHIPFVRAAGKDDQLLIRSDKIPPAVLDEIVVKKAHVSEFLLGFRRLLAEQPNFFRADWLLKYLPAPSKDDKAYSKALRKAERMRVSMNPWDAEREKFLREHCVEFVREQKEEQTQTESAGELDSRLLFKELASKMAHEWQRKKQPAIKSASLSATPSDFVAHFLGEEKGTTGELHNVFLREIKEVSPDQQFNRSLELSTSALGFISTDDSWAMALNLLSALKLSQPETKRAEPEKKVEVPSTPAPMKSASFEDFLAVLAQGYEELFKGAVESKRTGEFKEFKLSESSPRERYKHFCISFLFTLQEKFNHVKADPRIERDMRHLAELVRPLSEAANSTIGSAQKLKAIEKALTVLLFNNKVKLPRSVKPELIRRKLQAALENIRHSQLAEAVTLSQEICHEIQQDAAATLYGAELEKKQNFINGIVEILGYVGISARERANPDVWKEKLGLENYEKLRGLRTIFMRWKKLVPALNLAVAETKEAKMTKKRRAVLRLQVVEEFRKSLLEIDRPRSFFLASDSAGENGAEKAVERLFEYYLTFNGVVGKTEQTTKLLNGLKGLNLKNYERVLALIARILKPSDIVNRNDQSKMLVLGSHFLKTLFLSWNKLARNAILLVNGRQKLMLDYSEDKAPGFQQFSEDLVARIGIAYRLFEPHVSSLPAGGSLLELRRLVVLAQDSADEQTRSTNNKVRQVFETLMNPGVSSSLVEDSVPTVVESDSLLNKYGKFIIEANTLGDLSSDALGLHSFSEPLDARMRAKFQEKEVKAAVERKIQSDEDAKRVSDTNVQVFLAGPKLSYTEADKEFDENPLHKLITGKAAVSLTGLVFAVVSQVDDSDSKSLWRRCEQAVQRCSKFNLRSVIRNMIDNLTLLTYQETKPEDNRIVIVKALLEGLLQESPFAPAAIPGLAQGQYARMEFPAFGKYAQWYEQFLWIAGQFNPDEPLSRLSELNWAAVKINTEEKPWSSAFTHLQEIEERYLVLRDAQRQIFQTLQAHAAPDSLKETSAAVESKDVESKETEEPWDVGMLGLAVNMARNSKQLDIVSYPYKPPGSDEAITLCRLEVGYDLFGIFLNTNEKIFGVDKSYPIIAREGMVRVSKKLACAPARAQIAGILCRRELTLYLLRLLTTMPLVRDKLKTSIEAVLSATEEVSEAEEVLSKPVFTAEKLLETAWNVIAAQILTPRSGDYWMVEDKLKSPGSKDPILPEHLTQFRAKIKSAFASDELSLEQVECLREFLVIFGGIFEEEEERFKLYKRLLEWGIQRWRDRPTSDDNLLSSPPIVALFKLANAAELSVKHLLWWDYLGDLWQDNSVLGTAWILGARLALKQPGERITPWTLLEEYLTSRGNRHANEPICWTDLIDWYLANKNNRVVTDQDRLTFFITDDRLLDINAYNMTSFVARVLEKLGMSRDKLLVNISDVTQGEDSIQIQLIRYIDRVISSCRNDSDDWADKERRLRNFIHILWGRPIIMIVGREPTEEEKQQVVDGRLSLMIQQQGSDEWELGLRSPPRKPPLISPELLEEIKFEVEAKPLRQVVDQVLANTSVKAIFNREVTAAEHKPITITPSTKLSAKDARKVLLEAAAGQAGCGILYNDAEIIFVSRLPYQQEPFYRACLPEDSRDKDMQTLLNETDARARIVRNILELEGGCLPPNEGWLGSESLKAGGVVMDMVQSKVNEMGFCINYIPKPSELDSDFGGGYPQIFGTEYGRDSKVSGKRKDWFKLQMPLAIASQIYYGYREQALSELAGMLAGITVNDAWERTLSTCIVVHKILEFTTECRRHMSDSLGDVNALLKLLGELFGVSFLTVTKTQLSLKSFREEFTGISECLRDAFAKLDKYTLGPNLPLPSSAIDPLELQLFLGVLVSQSGSSELNKGRTLAENNEIHLAHCYEVLKKIGYALSFRHGGEAPLFDFLTTFPARYLTGQNTNTSGGVEAKHSAGGIETKGGGEAKSDTGTGFVSFSSRGSPLPAAPRILAGLEGLMNWFSSSTSESTGATSSSNSTPDSIGATSSSSSTSESTGPTFSSSSDPKLTSTVATTSSSESNSTSTVVVSASGSSSGFDPAFNFAPSLSPTEPQPRPKTPELTQDDIERELLDL